VKQALGMIETIGWTAALLAADRMVKTAYVELAGMEKTGSGYVTVLIRGDIASVQAALEEGAEEAARRGELVAAHAIPNPDPGLAPIAECRQEKRERHE
jgi:microcompartment protein CcmL/EutN